MSIKTNKDKCGSDSERERASLTNAFNCNEGANVLGVHLANAARFLCRCRPEFHLAVVDPSSKEKKGGGREAHKCTHKCTHTYTERSHRHRQEGCKRQNTRQ